MLREQLVCIEISIYIYDILNFDVIMKIFLYHTFIFSAVLISGLLAKGSLYSPYSIKRALENTALYIPNLDPFAQGSGLLQVERAFDNLISCCDVPERDVRFAINCGVNSKGIHMRTGVIDRAKDCAITVEPVFINSENIGNIIRNDFLYLFFFYFYYHDIRFL